jgi:DNA-binding winged helix-turn-helix (wHTH) protein/Tol biopolymer transport system component
MSRIQKMLDSPGSLILPVDSSSPSIVRFSTFEVNLETGELRQRGQKIKLQDQPFQVLAALLERPGEVVTREELHCKLWPAETFVDFDHGLNAAIKRLRDALGDSAETPIFIETLARRGYRFIAPVNGSAAAREAGIAAAPSPALAETKSTFRRPWLAVALLSVFAILGIVWALSNQPAQRAEVIERKVTTNSVENRVDSAAVSRDGKYLAYADPSGVYIKQLRNGETHRLALPENLQARVEDWFPDGAHLLISSEDQSGKPSLWTLSVFGGSPHLLAEAAAGASVSPDGSHIVYAHANRISDLGWEQWIMHSDGTDPVRVDGDKSTWVGPAKWSPDGNRIIYVKSGWDYPSYVSSIEVNDWRKAIPATILSSDNLGPAVYWLRDGRILYTLADSNSKQNADLWVAPLPASGKISSPAQRVTRGAGWISHLSGSSDGKVVMFLRGNSLPSVYLGGLAPDGTRLVSNKHLTLDENENSPTAWTSDGKAVLFSSNRNGTPEIFKQAVDQAVPESLVSSPAQLSQPRLTPDGSEILYISVPKQGSPDTPSSIYAVPVSGGTSRLVLQDLHIWNIQCSRAPSKLCMYSTSNGAISETFRFDAHTGKSPDPPQTDPSCNWSLSPDGSQRALILENSRAKIRFRSTSTGESHELPVPGWNQLNAIDWSADGRTLFVTWGKHLRESALLNVTLDGKASVLLHSNNSDILAAIPSPDGRSLAIAEASGTRNVWQIENF